MDFRLRVKPASGEVVLAAGAIGSPHILELSGIGGGDVFSANGVPVATMVS